MLGGTFAMMWITMLAWKAVDRGHYRATSWVVAPLVLAVSLALPGPARTPAIVSGILMGAFLGAVYSQRPLLEVASGAAATGLVVWAILRAVASCPGCRLAEPQALAGGFFLGAVSHGMILGHWYLNQPRLPIEPLKGATSLLIASIGAATAVGVVYRSELLGAQVPGGILPFSSSGYWWAWLVLIAGTGVLALMIRSTVWIRSTQSATGLLYLTMIPAMGAQFTFNLLALS